MLPLVSITVFLPLVGAAFLLVLREPSARTAHGVGLVTSGLTLLGALSIALKGVAPGFAQVEEVTWIPSIGSAYRVGLDGISLPLVLLTATLFLASLIFSVHLRERARPYVALFLLLETSCIGAFASLDLLLFYVFFEVTLGSMYFIIAV